MARVLLTRRMPAVARELLERAGHSVDQIDRDEVAPFALLHERAAGVDAILPSVADRVDAALLDAAGPQLRIVANLAVGYDNIDLDACRARGVRVSNTPGVLTDATADLAWALILAAARRVIEGDTLVRSGRWPGAAPLQLLGLELRGATLGIVGAGRIGTATALRAGGFGMRVVYAHPRANATLDAVPGTRRLELDELLAVSDVVSLHVPMRPENHHLIDAAALGRMKPSAVLVNTARGPVVDEAALVAALRERRIAAAGLDVYEHEPRLTPGLAELPNAVLLPHIGSATVATRDAMARKAAENIIAVLAGREPPDAVV